MSIFAPCRRGGAVATRLPQAREHSIQPDSILDKE
jgi:hypothetical protein